MIQPNVDLDCSPENVLWGALHAPKKVATVEACSYRPCSVAALANLAHPFVVPIIQISHTGCDCPRAVLGERSDWQPRAHPCSAWQ